MIILNSSWKIPYVFPKYLVEKKKNDNNKYWCRSSNIYMQLKNINKFIFIHNGMSFLKVKISNEHTGINRKIGTFALTRKYPNHPKKQKNKKK